MCTVHTHEPIRSAPSRAETHERSDYDYDYGICVYIEQKSSE